MQNKDYLIKLFQDLYVLEKEAKDLYEDFLNTLTDPEEINIVSRIRDDEITHMKIAEQLQEMIKNEK